MHVLLLAVMMMVGWHRVARTVFTIGDPCLNAMKTNRALMQALAATYDMAVMSLIFLIEKVALCQNVG